MWQNERKTGCLNLVLDSRNLFSSSRAMLAVYQATMMSTVSRSPCPPEGCAASFPILARALEAAGSNAQLVSDPGFRSFRRSNRQPCPLTSLPAFGTLERRKGDS